MSDKVIEKYGDKAVKMERDHFRYEQNVIKVLDEAYISAKERGLGRVFRSKVKEWIDIKEKG